MANVAAEQDIVSASDAQRVDDRSAAEQEVTPEADRSWHERLILRYVTWDTQHPHSLYLRLQHKLATTYYRLGLGRFDDGMVVTTTGRTSGLPRHVVLGANLIDGRPYVMNPFGERAHWYRNLLVDPIITVQQRGKTWTARATRVTEHDEAIALYEKTPGSTGSAMRWLLRVQGIAETAEAFAEHIDQVHFVRFDPVDEPGPPPMAIDLTWVWPVAGVVGGIAWLARRRLKVAFATAALLVPALVGVAAGNGRIETRYTDSGMHLKGRWATRA